MTRCVEFYDYWDQHPDFCGKSPSTIANINSYAKVLNELKELGIEKVFTIVNLPENNARPIFPLKDPIRKQVLNNVASWLKQNKKPSQADVKAWIRLDTTKRPECKEPEPCKLDVKKIGKCTCEYYDTLLPGCMRDPELICIWSGEDRKHRGCNLDGMQPPNAGRSQEEKNHGILSLCKTRNKGEPCENFVKRPMNNNRECSLTGYLPGNMNQCPMDAAKGTVIKISEEKKLELAARENTPPKEEVIPETVRSTPEDQPARDTFPRAGPSAVIKRAADYEMMAKEGDFYPITRRTAQAINQMVDYGVSIDRLEAHGLIERDGYEHYLEIIEEKILQEDAADADAIT